MQELRLDCAMGGGQVLRTGLALATLLKKKTYFENIRANRPKPGLQAQHLAGVRALEMLGAETRGASIGSTELVFTPPQSITRDKIVLDVGTAGSVTLVMQTLLLPLAFSGEKRVVEITGGTHVPFAPPFDYFQSIFLPAAEKFGIRAKAELLQHGFYPKGGGKARFTIEPCGKLHATGFIERGKLARVTGVSKACELPLEIAERQKKSALKKLFARDIDTKIEASQGNALGPGTFVFLKAEYENSVAGFSALGEKGKPAESVGEEAAQRLLEFHASDAAVDEHLADQLIPLMALAQGKSVIAAMESDHASSSMRVCESFLGTKFYHDAENRLIQTEGAGFENQG